MNTSVQCTTVHYTESDQPHAKFQQLRTMNERGPTGPVPGMDEVTPAAYHD
jgi:hypothetical protein